MGTTIRKYNAFRVRLQRQIRAACAKIAPLMRPGFSDEEYVDTFRELFSSEWSELQKYFDYYRHKDKTRPGRKFRFPPPRHFVLNSSESIRKAIRRKHTDSSEFDGALATELRAQLQQRSLRRITKQEEKQDQIRERTQNVNAAYLRKIMDRYRRSSPKERLLSVKELGKYDTKYTRKSLYEVLAGEEDYFIRQEAFFLLQQLGCAVFLPSKGRGRKERKNKLLMEYGGYRQDVGRSASDIIGDIEGGSIESMKQFHVFLSHESKDKEVVRSVVSRLNRLGCVVYVDWVSDREDLAREKASADTALALIERMNQSAALLVLRTNAEAVSPWVAWEVGYYQSTGKMICVFNLFQAGAHYEPEFLRMHPNVRDVDGALFVDVNGESLPMKDWINRALEPQVAKQSRPTMP